ncbi:MAG: DUF937 domain-containing protein [Rhizobiaceae bacterium]|nr:DUF937 domain-containing protein [Rhizobiaceae bacterium]
MDNDKMDLMNIASGMIANKLGVDQNTINGALNGLIGDGDQFDIGSLVSNLQSGDLADIAASWLGDGENASISTDQIQNLLGGDKISAAASQLGTSEGSLLETLQEALPQMIDQGSSGGSLLDSVGGIGGLASMAKKFL